MHKFEKRDAKSRTLVILAVVGLAAAITVGIFTAVRMIRKPAASKNDPKTGIVYDESAIEGGWDNLSPEEIAEKLNEKVAEGMINISMNTAPYFENGASEGAGNGLAVGDIHAAVLVDVQAQEPFSALADIFHIPECTAVRLHDRLCKLRHLLRYLHEKSPLPARKSGEQFPTLK